MTTKADQAPVPAQAPGELILHYAPNKAEARETILRYLEKFHDGHKLLALPSPQEALADPALRGVFEPFPRTIRLAALMAHLPEIDPDPKLPKLMRVRTDGDWARVLYQAVRLFPGEAYPDTTMFWHLNFLLLDYVQWRWPPMEMKMEGKPSKPERYRAWINTHFLGSSYARKSNATLRLWFGIDASRDGPVLFPDFFLDSNCANELGQKACMLIRGFPNRAARFHLESKRSRGYNKARNFGDIVMGINFRGRNQSISGLIETSEQDEAALERWVIAGENLDRAAPLDDRGPDDWRVTDDGRLIALLESLDKRAHRRNND